MNFLQSDHSEKLTMTMNQEQQSNLNMLSWLSNFYDVEKLEKLNKNQISLLYEKTQPKKVNIQSLENHHTSSYLVNSEDGFVPVHTWRNKGIKKCRSIKLEDDTMITSSDDHFFELSSGKWKYAKYLLLGDELKTKNGPKKVEQNLDAGEHTVYDFHINHSNHRYYTNNISSHNSGAGKSLFLANLGVNWVLAGLNVLYLTFELSAELVSMRIDSMLTGISTRDVFKNIDDVEIKVKMIEKRAGSFQVKYMPTGKNANDLRAYIKEYEIQNNIKFDIVLIDYLDLMFPIQKISSENLFVKDKYVSEQLRNLAMELKSVVVTASQLNRDSVMETEFDHSHISGGISKINTADNVFGILTSRAMRERGKYQIQLMKTRSSSGVNTKIDLEFDVDTLRITDLDDDKNLHDSNTSQPLSPASSSILNKVMRKTIDANTPEDVDETPVKAEINSSKLKDFLNNLKED